MQFAVPWHPFVVCPYLCTNAGVGRTALALHATGHSCAKYGVNVVPRPLLAPDCELSAAVDVADQSAVVRCAPDSALVQPDESKGVERVIRFLWNSCFAILIGDPPGPVLPWRELKRRPSQWTWVLVWNVCGAKWEDRAKYCITIAKGLDVGDDHTCPAYRPSWMVGGFRALFTQYPRIGLPHRPRPAANLTDPECARPCPPRTSGFPTRKPSRRLVRSGPGDRGRRSGRSFCAQAAFQFRDPGLRRVAGGSFLAAQARLQVAFRLRR